MMKNPNAHQFTLHCYLKHNSLIYFGTSLIMLEVFICLYHSHPAKSKATSACEL